MTLLELAVVMVIIAILASMLLPVYSGYLSRTEGVKCMANLKNLYVAASGHLLANNSWPQIPSKLLTEEPLRYSKSWVNALEPYGAPHPTWICPTRQHKAGVSMEDLEKDENYRIDYIGTPYDDKPTSPHRTPRYPWFLEKAGLHGRGNLMILEDGTTTSLSDLIDQNPK